MGLGAAMIVALPGRVEGAPAYSLVPRLSVEETYDDNVDRVADNRREDYITRVGAGLDLSFTDIRFGASLGYGISSEFFAKGTEEDGRLGHDASASLSFQATRRLTLTAGDGLRISHTTETAAEQAVPGAVDPSVPPPPEATPPGTVPSRRTRQISNTATVGARYRYDRFTTLGATYGYQVQRYDAPDLVDTESHTAGLSANRQVSRRDTVGVSYSVKFPDTEDEGRDVEQIHDARLTWAHDFTADVSARVGVGATWTDEGDVEVGPVGDASVEKRVGRTRFRAAYASEYRVDTETGAFSRADTVSVGAAQEVSAATSISAGLAGGRSEPLDGDEGETLTWSATAGVRTMLARWLAASVGYTFERNDAPPGSDSFRSNRVTLGLTVLFPAVARGQL